MSHFSFPARKQSGSRVAANCWLACYNYAFNSTWEAAEAGQLQPSRVRSKVYVLQAEIAFPKESGTPDERAVYL